MQAIRNGLPRNDPAIQYLDRAIQALQGLQRGNYSKDPDELLRGLQGIIDPLRNVELQLSRELQLLTEKENIRSAQEEDVPANYKKGTEDYYKALGSLKP